MNNDFNKRKRNLEILLTKEELLQEQEEELNELNKANNELNLQKKKNKIKKVIILLFILLIIYKSIFGSIYIKNNISLSTDNIRFYEFTVNNQFAGTQVNIYHDFPIIPYLVYIRTDTSHDFFNDYKHVEYEGNDEKYILDLKMYTCYNKNGFRMMCSNQNQTKEENKDFKILNLKIRSGENNRVIYNGKWKKDITDIIKDTQNVSITIRAKYGNTTVKILSGIRKTANNS